MCTAVAAMGLSNIDPTQLKQLETISSRPALLKLASNTKAHAFEHRKIASEYFSTMTYALTVFSIVTLASVAFISIAALFAAPSVITTVITSAIAVEMLNLVNLVVSIYSGIKSANHLKIADNFEMISTASDALAATLSNGRGLVAGIYQRLFSSGSSI